MDEPVLLSAQDVLRLEAHLAGLGAALHSAPVHTCADVVGVWDRLTDLCDLLTRMGLEDVWIKADHGLNSMIWMMEKMPESSVVSPDDANQLAEAHKLLESGFRSQAEYCRLVPVSRSVPEADFGIRLDLDPPLPPRVTFHLDEALRCWRVGHYLAALLFTFVATELITRYYYERVLGHPASADLTWGKVVGALRNHPHNAPVGLMEALGKIVKGYRNQLVHGEAEIDRAEAETLYGVCARATRDMIGFLVRNSFVHTAPTEAEEKAILTALDALSGKASRDRIAQVLCGKKIAEVTSRHWDELPDFGVLDNLTPAHAAHKIDCCIRKGLIRARSDLTLELVEGSEGAESARRLAVDRLFSEVLRAAYSAPDTIWPWIQRVPKATKEAFLEILPQEPYGDDMSEVLRSWYPYERPQVRRSINRALQDLGCQPLPRNLSFDSGTVPEVGKPDAGGQ